MQRHLLLGALSALSMAAGAAMATGKAHEHGVVRLDVAVEGNQLVLALEVPLDNLLGFERAPRTDAERKAAAEALARLRNADKAPALFAADAAAQCLLKESQVQAPVLEPAAPVAGKVAANQGKAAAGHADLDARLSFQCAQPTQLRTLDVGLFDAFPRIQRIVVQVADAQAQSKITLRRPARRVQLGR